MLNKLFLLLFNVSESIYLRHFDPFFTVTHLYGSMSPNQKDYHKISLSVHLSKFDDSLYFYEAMNCADVM